MIDCLTYQTRRWRDCEDASAAAEFGLVFPLLFMMMLGLWDLGNGIILSQKTIAASQVVADLIGRETTIDDDELRQAFDAGRLAMLPYPTEPLTIDIVSVAFDDEGDPVARWQEDSNGGNGVNANLASTTAGLGGPGDGAVAVQTTYTYDPTFAGTILDEFDMREIAFARGRKTAVVGRD